jgi:hypothetical protein
LHLALKTAQGIFQRFTLLNDDFCHCSNSPPIRFGLDTARCLSLVHTAPGDYRTRYMASSNQLGVPKSSNLYARRGVRGRSRGRA